MAPKSAIRLLVMGGIISGLAYGSTRIDELPPGPRKMIARVGVWLQEKAGHPVAQEEAAPLAAETQAFPPAPLLRIQPTVPMQQVAVPANTSPSQFGEVAGITQKNRRLQALMQQIAALGSTNTKLEAWGYDGQLYRFQCELPLAGQSGLTQHFEATAESKVAAIEKVLAEMVKNR